MRARRWQHVKDAHTLSTNLNPRDANGRLSLLVVASSPGAFMASPSHPTLLFTTYTCSPAAGKSTVDRLTFRAVTRTLSFDQTWQSSTKAMLLVSSDASAKSPRRAPGTGLLQCRSEL